MEILHKEEIFPLLKELVSEAENYILISSPWIKYEILEKLLSEKSIKIQAVIRNSELEDLIITDRKVFDFFKKKGGDLYLNNKIHSKFIIIDGKKAVLGSSNLTITGLLDNGNIETAVFITEKDQIKVIEEQFKKIVKESVNIFGDIAGIVLSSLNSINCEVLLFEPLPQQTYIKIPVNTGFLLGRIANVKNLNSTVFNTFINFVSPSVLSDRNKLRLIFSEKDKEWRNAALLSYMNENNPEITVANVEILTEFNPEKIGRKESILKTPLKPPDSGSPIYKLKNEEEIEEILHINHAGYIMKEAVNFGKLYNTDLKTYIDLEKIYTMHMAVLGTTGSGKTTFVKRILENIKSEDIKIFVFDLYGEYADFLSAEKTEVIQFPNILFPINFENIRDILREYGISIQERSLDERRISSFLRLYLKPDIDFIGYKDKSLEDLLLESSEIVSQGSPLREEILTVIDMLKDDYGIESLHLQPEIVKTIKSSIKSTKTFIVFNFQNVEDPRSRTNIAGLIMKYIYKNVRISRKKSLIILEEAQNFAPEKGYGEIQAGISNLSYIMTRKIATEGRKFNLGLVAITQRPANISKYILSQLNTQAVFKLINRNDLEAVSVFFEYSKEDIFGLLPFLKPGTGFITGLGVPFGMVAEIKLG